MRTRPKDQRMIEALVEYGNQLEPEECLQAGRTCALLEDCSNRLE